jgi:hypothetical protein
MRKRPVGLPPAIEWDHDTSGEATPQASAIRATVQDLIHAVWRRFPMSVREIIALDLDAIVVIRGEKPIRCLFDQTVITLYVGDDRPTPQEELAAMWVLAEAFGQAFWWSMVSRSAGEDPRWVSPQGGSQGSPEYALYQTHLHPLADVGYCRMNARLPAVLALACGFANEYAAAMDLDETRDYYAEETPELVSDLGNVAWLFRERQLRR